MTYVSIHVSVLLSASRHLVLYYYYYYMLLLCGPLQSHDPGLHPWFRPCVLGVRSIQLTVAMPRPKHSAEHPYGSPVPGTLDALLSHGTTSLSRVGYLVCLYLGQPASGALRVRLLMYLLLSSGP